MRRAPVAALALLALAGPARAQLLSDDYPTFTLTGRVLGSYAGGWTPTTSRMLQTHQFVEGVSGDLTGWLWDARYIRFRSFVIVLHLDQLSPRRSPSLSLGYGSSLRFFSRSFLPITISAVRGLTLPGSTAEAVQSATTTSLLGTAQLVSPLLPKVDLQLQRTIADAPEQPRSVADSISGSIHGESGLHRYAGVATWSAQRTGDQPATGTLLASVADDLYPARNTSARLQASIAQGRGFGGADDQGFTGYQTSASLLSRLGSGTLLRTGYAFSGAGSDDRDQISHAVTAGATFDLRPVPLLLGEGAAATYSTIDTPSLKRTLSTVSAAQGISTFGRLDLLQYSLGVTGQAGYSQVSDGREGPLYGYGASAGVTANPGIPVRAVLSYALRNDESSAALSSRSLNANVTATLTRGRLLLLPAFSYSRLVRADPTAPDGWFEANVANLLISGAAPVLRTNAVFAAGWSEGWSNQPATATTGSVFAHAATTFSFGPGTFGNLSGDLTHVLGGGTSGALLASAVWSFRASSLSFNYLYNRAWPSAGGTQSVSVLFIRSFSTSFFPEHP